MIGFGRTLGDHGCPDCLKKQQQIDALKEENHVLKQKLRYQERKAQEGFSVPQRPSSKIRSNPIGERRRIQPRELARTPGGRTSQSRSGWGQQQPGTVLPRSETGVLMWVSVRG